MPKHRVARIAYSPAEAAEAIGTSRAFIYSLMANGSLPSVKVGKLRRILADDLEEFVTRSKREAS